MELSLNIIAVVAILINQIIALSVKLIKVQRTCVKMVEIVAKLMVLCAHAHLATVGTTASLKCAIVLMVVLVSLTLLAVALRVLKVIPVNIAQVVGR